MAGLGPLRTGTLIYTLALAGWDWFAITYHHDEGAAITALVLSAFATILGTAFLTRSKHRDPFTAKRVQKRAWVTIAVIGAGPILAVALWLSLVLALSVIHPLAALVSSLFFLSTVVLFVALPALMIFTLYPLFSNRERVVLAAAAGLLVLTVIAEILATRLYATAWMTGLSLTSITAVAAFLLALFNSANRPPVPDILETPLDLSEPGAMGQVATHPQEGPEGPTQRR